MTTATEQTIALDAARAYHDAEVRILARLKQYAVDGADAPGWQQQSLARAQVLRREAVRELAAVNERMATIIERAFAKTYADAADEQFANLDGYLLTPEQKTVSAQQKAAVRKIVTELAEGVTDAQNQVLRRIDDTYREIVGDSVQSAVTRGESRRAAGQRALDTLFAKGTTTFKSQSGRTWRLPDYVEMAMRTGFAQAQIGGHEAALDKAGLDMCIVQPGPRACEICDKWARKILSRGPNTGTFEQVNYITGKRERIKIDATLAEARADGFQHPNCRCSIRGYVPGATNPQTIVRPPWDAAGYEAQQKQRAIESDMRKAKLSQALGSTPAEQAKAAAHVKQLKADMAAHLEAHPDLKRQSSRESIGARFATPAEREAAKRAPRAPVDVSQPIKPQSLRKPVDVTPDAPRPVQRSRVEQLRKLPSKPETLRAAAKAANPGYQAGVDFQSNCHHVVAAVELRARGYDVIARPTAGGVGRTNAQIVRDYRTADGETPVFSRMTDLGTTRVQMMRKLAKDMPEGARGVISGAWTRGGGHIFNWEKRDGMIVLVEGQSATSPAMVQTYVAKMKLPGLSYMRTDDLEFTDDALDHAVEERTDARDAQLDSWSSDFSQRRTVAYLQERLDLIDVMTKRFEKQKADWTAEVAEIIDSLVLYEKDEMMQRASVGNQLSAALVALDRQLRELATERKKIERELAAERR